MDLFERLFGISPDGGSGAAELLWIVAVALVVAGARAARQARRDRPRRPGA